MDKLFHDNGLGQSAAKQTTHPVEVVFVTGDTDHLREHATGVS